ncbi:MAG: D-alanyl-D-alanine carboxypeptidase [Clostridiales bacterium]|nr:D-alanyl-D-alanine carboxypeptidase [Clostridiales bacterium]
MKKVIVALLAFALLAAAAAPAFATADWDEGLPVYLEEDEDTAAVDASVFEDEGGAVAAVGQLSIPAPSAILMEKETGRVLFEKNADDKLEPASITKIMTVLLVIEAIEAGKISLDEMVTTSAHAASHGGSQIYLEENEQMSVRDLLKAVVVSSANDASVALAEHLYGSEETFVARMNERAKELGMTNTHFTNCSGLLDDPSHVTTARDVAIMSRELIRHDLVKQFSTIWMDTVRGGKFGLTNTNKLIYYYKGATGLKTGYTRRSMYCLSATAERDGVEYIAVVMHCDTSDQRFESAKALLNYAFANFALCDVYPDSPLLPIRVVLGKSPYVQPLVQGGSKIVVEKEKASSLEKTVELPTKVSAPLKTGDRLGTLTVKSGGEVIGEYPIVAGHDIGRLSWGDLFVQFLKLMFTGGL